MMSKKAWVITAFGAVVSLIVVRAGYDAFRITSSVKSEMRLLEEHRGYILHHANHALIVKEAREMLQNPDRYRLRGGDLVPPDLPHYIDSLEPYNVVVFPQEAVLIRFDDFSPYMWPPRRILATLPEIHMPRRFILAYGMRTAEAKGSQGSKVRTIKRGQ
jgi:hypothetical protein